MIMQFNLDNYELVADRHARALAAFPDLRCVIVNHTTPQDRAAGVWVVEARVYLNADDQVNNLPKAVDWAFEVDGQGAANRTSALENASTSALGRALRWALGGSKDASREEMEKVQRGITPVGRNWLAEAEELALSYSVEKLRALYNEARSAKADDATLEAIKEFGQIAANT